MERKADVGVVGMAVMGQNLALNIARHGYLVAVYNRTAEKTRRFVERAGEERILAAYSVADFVALLKRPRKIILMVKAGEAVDQMIEKLLPYMDEGDLIVDGGNSHFLDTQRRLEMLKSKGILFLGMGVSGGEKGALHGPSLMPGGSRRAYDLVKDILEDIAAKSDEGPCCTYIGDGGAGHFVKMVHNGIEYAIMGSIAEVYDIMRKLLRMKAEDMAEIFEEWNRGPLNSFLVEITAKILKKKDDETGKPVVDVILDRAHHKGTGKWTSEVALQLGVPALSISAAFFERMLSFYKEDRLAISKMGKEAVSFDVDKKELLKSLEGSLLFSMLSAFSQGIWIIEKASEEYGFGINIADVLRVWKAGCIIRARVIDFVKAAALRAGSGMHLLKDSEFFERLEGLLPSASNVSKVARDAGIPTPVLNSSIDYFLSMKSAQLPANLIQAQRDFFGAHTFERVDRDGFFHIEWEGGEG